MLPGIRLAGGGALLLSLLFPLSAAAATRYVNPDGICGGNAPCYTSIQAAIDASSPGDVIQVQTGVHTPAAKIVVHTSVTILGPQAGINPLPAEGNRTPGDLLAEAIIDGSGGGLSGLMVITASDVEINGLEFRNGSGDLIDSESSIPTSNVRITHCIVHDSSGDEGIQLRAVAGAVIECNYVFSTAGDGINLCCGSTDGSISYNEVANIGSPDAAIYAYQTTGTRIEGNLVHHTATNEGIKVGSKNGSDAALLPGAVVRANTIHDTAQDGIAVYQGGTTVSCNEVYASSSENGGIYVAFAVSNVSIVDNHVHDNSFDVGKWGDPAGIMIGTAVDASTLTVDGNNLENNVPNGLTSKAAALVDATGNWWGDASGPSGAGGGTGDAVSVNVTFSPWLTSPAAPVCPEIGDCGSVPVPVRTTTWGRLKSIHR